MALTKARFARSRQTQTRKIKELHPLRLTPLQQPKKTIGSRQKSQYLSQKDPRAHESKIGTSPPPPKKNNQNTPPQNEEFIGVEVFLQKELKISGRLKTGVAFSGLRIAGGKIHKIRNHP